MKKHPAFGFRTAGDAGLGLRDSQCGALHDRRELGGGVELPRAKEMDDMDGDLNEEDMWERDTTDGERAGQEEDQTTRDADGEGEQSEGEYTAGALGELEEDEREAEGAGGATEGRGIGGAGERGRAVQGERGLGRRGRVDSDLQQIDEDAQLDPGGEARGVGGGERSSRAWDRVHGHGIERLAP